MIATIASSCRRVGVADMHLLVVLLNDSYLSSIMGICYKTQCGFLIIVAT